MTRQGMLAYASNHLVTRPDRLATTTEHVSKYDPAKKRGDAKTSLAQGIFRSTSRGYGFVKLDEVEVEKVSDDVFIPPSGILSAMDGDRVRLRITKGKRSDRTEGVIEEIIERAKRQFVGTFQLQGKTAVVWLDGVDASSR